MPSPTWVQPGTAPMDNGPCFCAVPMIQGCTAWRSQSGIPEKERICPLKKGEVCSTARSFHLQYSVPGRWVSPQCSADHTFAPAFIAPATPTRENTPAAKANRATKAISAMKAESRAMRREERAGGRSGDRPSAKALLPIDVQSTGFPPVGTVLGGKSSEPGQGKKKLAQALPRPFSTKAGRKGVKRFVLSPREYQREKKAAKRAGRPPKYVKETGNELRYTALGSCIQW